MGDISQTARDGSIAIDTAETSAREYLDRFGLQAATIDVTTESNPSTVRVDVQIAYEEVALVAPFFFKDASLGSSVVMLAEDQRGN